MNQGLLECREKALSLKSSSNPPCYQNGRKKGYMRILKDLWDDVGYVNLGLSAQNLRDHAAAITDENSQISVRGDPSTVLDETEEVGASMLSQTEGLEPAQCKGENLSNVNVVEGSNSHISSDIADQRAPQGRTATCKDQNTENQIKPNLPDYDVLPSETKNKTWGSISYACFCNTVNDVYDEIVHYRRNIFNVPSGRAGKSFIEELTFWIKQFNSDSDLNSVALKAFMVLPTLILQKPSATSKSKEHSEAMERRLALWKQGDIDLLLKEVRFFQGRFVNSKKPRKVKDISKTFSKLVLQGKLTAAMKLLDNESSSGLLDLSPDVLQGLQDKHLQAADIAEESSLHGPIDYIPPNVYDLIDEESIYNSASKTKGSAGPSGMDAELYKRILCSKNFKTEGKILREELAVFTRTIGVGEVLRRIVGKTVSGFLKEEIKEAAGPLQVCAGHNAGAEAAIHAMSQVFDEEGTDGILLIDASNAFNQMNRSAALHNIQIMCKEMALYVINTYSWLARDVRDVSIFGYPPCWCSTAGEIYICLLCHRCTITRNYNGFFEKGTCSFNRRALQ